MGYKGTHEPRRCVICNSFIGHLKVPATRCKICREKFTYERKSKSKAEK